MDDFIKQPITDTLEKNYMPYVMSVILSRALPEIDGFKPSHRKILYTMYKMGLLKGLRTKSANVVGQTMKLNPHGDESIYAALVRLSKDNQSLLYPFVDSKGNFGKVYSRDMSYAASRYTEVKLMPICESVFGDVEKDTVDFQPNYDGTSYEPVLLPVKFPTILVNPTKGIAVGMASNICSFRMSEIIDATIALIKHPKTDLLRFIKGPDFPTGGAVIYDEKVFRQMMEEGTGTFRLRAKTRYDQKEHIIEVYEIPYTTTNEAIIDKTIQLVKEGVIKEISDIRDESDLHGLKIAIDLKRGVDPARLLQKLYKETTMEDTFSCNFNLVINAYPMQIGVRDILLNWLDFRIGCVRRSIRFDLRKYEEKLHLIQGLKKVLLDIDRVIAVIRQTEQEKDVVPNLMMRFVLDEIQAEYVANIRLRNINREFIQNRIDEEEQLIHEVAKLKEIYEKDDLIQDLIIEELRQLKKQYEIGRKTEILEAVDPYIEDVAEQETIEALRFVRTREQYFKQITENSLEKSAEHRLKADDELLQEWKGDSRYDILFFTSAGTVYKLKASQVETVKASDLGSFLPNLLNLSPSEEVLYMVPTLHYEGFMLFGFENGKIAKVPMNAYATKTNRKQLVNAFYQAEKLISIHYLPADKDILVYRYANQKEHLLLVHTALISEKSSRTTRGVQVVRMNKHTKMNAVDVLEAEQSAGFDRYRVRTLPSSGIVRKPFDTVIKK